MNYKKRISSSHDIMLGKPVIKGTRITVELILKKLSEEISFEELIQDYPGLTKEDIYACFAYSADVLSHEEELVS